MKYGPIKFPAKVHYNTRKKDGKEQWFYLNLNGFRNLHHFTKNKVKQKCKEIVREMNLEHIPFDPPYRFVWTLYSYAPKIDVSNPCSICDKFMTDALVEAGLMDDDNCQWIPAVEYRYGGQDRKDPRIMLEIHPFVEDNDEV